MEFVTAGWYIGKYLSFVQTIRGLISDDWEILFVVIRLGVTGLKTAGSVCFLELFRGGGGRVVGWCDLLSVWSIFK